MPKQCRERYHNYLQNGIIKDPLTPEEIETIKRLQKELGNKWADIAKQLPNRSANQIKNYWHTNVKKTYKRDKGSNKRKREDDDSENESMELEEIEEDNDDEILGLLGDIGDSPNNSVLDSSVHSAPKRHNSKNDDDYKPQAKRARRASTPKSKSYLDQSSIPSSLPHWSHLMPNGMMPEMMPSMYGQYQPQFINPYLYNAGNSTDWSYSAVNSPGTQGQSHSSPQASVDVEGSLSTSGAVQEPLTPARVSGGKEEADASSGLDVLSEMAEVHYKLVLTKSNPASRINQVKDPYLFGSYPPQSNFYGGYNPIFPTPMLFPHFAQMPYFYQYPQGQNGLPYENPQLLQTYPYTGSYYPGMIPSPESSKTISPQKPEIAKPIATESTETPTGEPDVTATPPQEFALDPPQSVEQQVQIMENSEVKGH